MSALGRDWRLTVANDSGLAFPAGGLTVRYRRWRFTNSGAVEWEGSEQTATIGASLATGSQATSSTISNGGSGEGWLGAQFIVQFPALTGTTSASGSVSVWHQHSTDGGTTWPSTPDNRRGFLVAAEQYTSVSSPAARSGQGALG